MLVVLVLLMLVLALLVSSADRTNLDVRDASPAMPATLAVTTTRGGQTDCQQAPTDDRFHVRLPSTVDAASIVPRPISAVSRLLRDRLDALTPQCVLPVPWVTVRA